MSISEMNKYGWSMTSRKSDIAEKLKYSKVQYPLLVMGKLQHLPQIRVRINMPIYRLANGRTKTFQREFLAKHVDAPADLFTKDEDAIAAQKAQHAILLKLIKDEDLLKEFESGTQQTEPIIATSTGVVVNGNRRLCAWRELYYSGVEKYKHLEYIELVVLPEECDETEIKALEKRLQIQKTHRAEYKWHNKAAMIKEELEAGEDPDDLAKSYDMKRKDMGLLQDALGYADAYLNSIGKKDQWSLVDGDEYAFTRLADMRTKLKGQGRKELLEAVCFKLLENRDYSRRLYEIIPDVAENIDAIAAGLKDENILPKSEGVAPNNPTSTGDDIDILGGSGGIIPDDISTLATTLRNTKVRVGDFVKRTIDEQKAIKDEQKSAKFLINTLAKVSKELNSARTAGLKEEMNLNGVAAQLKSIQTSLDAIKQWVNEHASNE